MADKGDDSESRTKLLKDFTDAINAATPVSKGTLDPSDKNASIDPENPVNKDSEKPAEALLLRLVLDPHRMTIFPLLKSMSPLTDTIFKPNNGRRLFLLC